MGQKTFTMKKYLFIFCTLFFNTIYAQTDVGTLQVLAHDKSGPLIGCNIYIKGVNIDTTVMSDINGQYELQLKAGQYVVEISYLGYEDTGTEITIKPNEIFKHISELRDPNFYPFEAPGEVIDDLYGFWTVVYLKIGNIIIYQSEQIRSSGVAFHTSEHGPGIGKVSYYDGCNGCGSYWFKHFGNGKIQMPDMPIECTLQGCSSYNRDLNKAMSKLPGEFEVKFIKETEILIKKQHLEMRLKRKPVELEKLFGSWRVDYIKYGSEKIEQPAHIGDSGITFSTVGEKYHPHFGTALFTYNDGCGNGGKSWLLHKGRGVISITGQRKWTGDKNYSCKNTNDVLLERIPSLMGGFRYVLKDDNTLIIKKRRTSYLTKKRLEMKFIRINDEQQ